MLKQQYYTDAFITNLNSMLVFPQCFYSFSLFNVMLLWFGMDSDFLVISLHLNFYGGLN